MILQPGCRFAVAPRFHIQADWPRRLLIAPGVQEADGCFVPIPDWRPPTVEELAMLVGASDTPTSPEDLDTSLCLLKLPEHLGSAWWQLLEGSAEEIGRGSLPNFDWFAGQVGEFLTFKNLRVPPGVRYDVVMSNPGQEQVQARLGLQFNFAASAPSPGNEVPRSRQLWGGINLGDEETWVVVVNLSCGQLAAEVRRRIPDQPLPTGVGELAGQFFRCCPDYPLVRLMLKPGEGYRLPSGGLILDRYLVGKSGPDILLLIS